MSKHKKKQKLSRKSFLLDTSVLLERIKYPQVVKDLDKLDPSQKLVTSSFSIYEYKTGLLLCLIDFYSMVNAGLQIDEAVFRASDKWGRDQSYSLILIGVLLRIKKSLDTTDHGKMVNDIEFAIIDILESLAIGIEDVVGSFIGDEVVKFKVSNAKDFTKFSELYKSRDTIPQTSFWEGNYTELEKLVNDENLKRKYKSLHENLCKVFTNVSEVDRLKGLNRGVGDAIISVDMPRNYVLVSYDGSFEYLCPPLNKTQIKLEKPKKKT